MLEEHIHRAAWPHISEWRMSVEFSEKVTQCIHVMEADVHEFWLTITLSRP